MKKRHLAVLVFSIAFAASSCGASTDTNTAEPVASTEAADTGVDDTATNGPTTVTDDSQDANTNEAEAGDVAAPTEAPGTFQLDLANGMSFTESLRCNLEPEVAAGQEILYSAVGLGTDYLVDVTQWGDTEYNFGPSVEVSDRTSYDTLWRSVTDTGLELTLDGNVIRGTGGFYEGEDLNGPTVEGVLTVTC